MSQPGAIFRWFQRHHHRNHTPHHGRPHHSRRWRAATCIIGVYVSAVSIEQSTALSAPRGHASRRPASHRACPAENSPARTGMRPPKAPAGDAADTSCQRSARELITQRSAVRLWAVLRAFHRYPGGFLLLRRNFHLMCKFMAIFLPHGVRHSHFMG